MCSWLHRVHMQSCTTYCATWWEMWILLPCLNDSQCQNSAKMPAIIFCIQTSLTTLGLTIAWLLCGAMQQWSRTFRTILSFFLRLRLCLRRCVVASLRRTCEPAFRVTFLSLWFAHSVTLGASPDGILSSYCVSKGSLSVTSFKLVFSRRRTEEYIL